MPETPRTPAGWYPDAQGEMRYWDGQAWTAHTATNYAQTQPQAPQQPTQSFAAVTSVPVIEEVGKRPWVRRWQFWLVVVVVTFLGIGAIGNAATPDSTGDASDKQTAKEDPVRASDEPTPTPEPTRTTEPAIVLLFVTDQKDGDSWVASDGKEYRLGLINTPERNERCGPEATAFTRKFLDDGFVVDAYTTDSHGRSVAEVRDKAGKSLNVALAKSGLGDDRYLEQFRHENVDLGRRLDDALASPAKPDCKQVAKPVPLVNRPKKKAPKPAEKCMAGYSPCLPIVADLNCPDIGHPVTVTGDDPYGLDRDGDGTGCD
ncbi:DUF2510 domain-containing protein [Aeromicrobium sp. 9AM]|uniref:DUF2510 domain-containing protein n=1 Tax=Aeromicrobium sp. 9AM TaxID=2653126 RepID=UPI0012F1E7BA|nr:DUF2510 domain-containing protein [Aeromicrobium sp. 9AM]VXB78763.1 conserved hypothetical protein [Aeromicrobium sp. 9AM]